MRVSQRQKLAAAFRTRALRCTPPRYAVLDYLLRNPVHATAEEVFRAVNETDPRASRATVYNSLHALTRAGLVREVLLDGKAARFDANVHRHHHFVCERCGAVKDVAAWTALPRPPLAAFPAGSVVETYEVVFRGRCAGCSGATDLEERNG